MKRHAILVGLPGAGKTTVGRRVSELLSTEITDLDEEVEAVTARSIPKIFAESGEAEFRKLERAAMERALAAPPHLIAAGAGWIAQPGNLEAAREAGALVVCLRVSPAVAAARVGEDETRPLLAGGDPTRRLEQLLQERETWYSKADAVVDAEGEVESVAARLMEVISPE